MKPSPEQRMDQAIFRSGKDARYGGRIADIRRFRLNMLGDDYPKPDKTDFWARAKRFINMDWKGLK